MPRRMGRRNISRWLSGRITRSRLVGVKQSDLEQLLWQGHSRLTGGDHDTAARIYELAVSLWPERPEPRLGLGACRQAAGDLPGAEAAYSEVLAIDAGDPFARANRAEIRLLLGRADEARADLDRISTAKPLPDALSGRVAQLVSAAGSPTP